MRLSIVQPTHRHARWHVCRDAFLCAVSQLLVTPIQAPNPNPSTLGSVYVFPVFLFLWCVWVLGRPVMTAMVSGSMIDFAFGYLYECRSLLDEQKRLNSELFKASMRSSNKSMPPVSDDAVQQADGFQTNDPFFPPSSPSSLGDSTNSQNESPTKPWR